MRSMELGTELKLTSGFVLSLCVESTDASSDNDEALEVSKHSISHDFDREKMLTGEAHTIQITRPSQHEVCWNFVTALSSCLC